MLKIRTSVILRVAAALLIFTWMGSARAEEVSVSYATFTASYMDHLVAFERGYFAEEGLSDTDGFANLDYDCNLTDATSLARAEMRHVVSGTPWSSSAVKAKRTRASRSWRSKSCVSRVIFSLSP